MQAREHFGCDSFSQLQDRVLHEPAMLPQLLSFLTVQVSEMFRDPAYFRALREKVVPHLRTYPSLKVWVAGCSDGEELYSLAILFREEGLEERTIFYATDINPAPCERPRPASMPSTACRFSPRTTGARAANPRSRTITRRPMARRRSTNHCASATVFSDHSLVSDAVFAEVHLVSCRNVLIYFDNDLQERAVGYSRIHWCAAVSWGLA